MGCINGVIEELVRRPALICILFLLKFCQERAQREVLGQQSAFAKNSDGL